MNQTGILNVILAENVDPRTCTLGFISMKRLSTVATYAIIVQRTKTNFETTNY